MNKEIKMIILFVSAVALIMCATPVHAWSVTIEPTSVAMTIGQSQTFNSTIQNFPNATKSYQWFLNGTQVSGATDDTWNFKPISTGNYIVYLIVDCQGNYQSNTAKVVVYPAVGTTMFSNPITFLSTLLPFFSVTLLVIKQNKKRSF